MTVLKSEIYGLPLRFLNGGNFANVYQTGYKPRFTIDALAYKEYKSPGSPDVGVRARKAVVFRDSLPRSGREFLDERFAWPRDVVLDPATGICGYLMPLADEAFLWDTGKVKGKMRTLDWLAAPEPFWQTNDVVDDMATLTLADRVFLMLQLASAVSWLHEQGWVYGDLSFNNVAFALPRAQQPPRLLLFDCDETARLTDRQRAPQPHSLNWAPPGHTGEPSLQDFQTDVYKLALAIIRCLKPEAGATSTKDVDRLVGILDDKGVALIRRAVSEDPSERPAATELVSYLKDVAQPLMIRPAIVAAELVTPLVLRGANAQVLWHIEHAQDIRVLVGDNPGYLVRQGTLADYPDGCVFPVTSPGQVTVIADNRYGETRRAIGNVAPYEFPRPDLALDTLPKPDVLLLPDLAIGPTPAPPDKPPTTPVIPALPRFELLDVLSALAADKTIKSPGTRVNALVENSRSLLDLLNTDKKRLVAALRRKNSGK